MDNQDNLPAQEPKKSLVNLKDLESSSKTSLEFLHPITNELVGVKITGFTPDSTEWRAHQRRLSNPNSKTSLYIEKGGRQSIDLDSDAAEKKRELLAAVVTSIEGLDNWEFSPENVADLFENPKLAWMVEQWGDHLDERKNFF